MPRGETVREVRARMVYSVDQASISRILSANKLVREDFEKNIGNWPKGMKKAVNAAFAEFVAIGKKLEAEAKRQQVAMTRAVETEEKKRNRQHAHAIAENMKFDKDHAERYLELKERYYKKEGAAARRAERERDAAEDAHFRKMKARLTEAERFRADILKAQARNERAAAARRQDSMNSMGQMYGRGPSSAPERDPWLTMGGFAGLASGGGFGGMSFGGRGAPYVAGAMALGRIGSNIIDNGTEREMAATRMMGYVGSGERSEGNSMKRMTQDAEMLAYKIGVSVPEAMEAMRTALTNAVPAGAAARFVELARPLSLMEGVDLSSTVSSLAAIRNAYGMTFEQMKTIPDMLYAAVDKGNVKLGDLAGEIGQVSGIAADAGINVRDLLASLAALTIKGTPGDVAATSMRQIAMRIANPEETAKKEQERIGVHLNAMDVESKGLAQAMVEFDEGIKKAGSSWAKAFSNDIRTLKMIPQLLRDSGQGIKDARAQQDQAILEGATDKQNRAQNATAMIAQLRASASWKNVGASEGAWMGSQLGGASQRFAIVADWIAGGDMGNQVAGANMLAKNDAQDRATTRRFNEAHPELANRTKFTPPRNYGDIDFTMGYKDETDTTNPTAKKEEARLQGIRRQYDALVQSLDKVQQRYTTLSGSTLDRLVGQQDNLRASARHWFAQMEALKEKAAQMEEQGRERGIALSDKLETKRLDYRGNTAMSKSLVAYKKGQSSLDASRYAEDPSMSAFLGKRSVDAFESMRGANLLAVGRKGMVNYADEKSYIEGTLAREGLEGVGARKRRHELQDDVRRFGRDVSKSYTQFKRNPFNKDADFGKWFADQKAGAAEDQFEKGEADKTNKTKAEASEAERKFNQARGWFDALTGVINDQRVVAEGLKSTFEAINDLASQPIGDIEALYPKMHALFAEAREFNKRSQGAKAFSHDEMHSVLQGTNESDAFDAAFPTDSKATSFPAPRAKAAVVVQQNVNNNVEAEVVMKFDPTGLSPELIAKLVARGLVPAIRTEIARGSGTLNSSK